MPKGMISFGKKNAMHEIERKMVTLLEQGHSIDVASLGGIEEIITGWNGIACSRMADEFLDVLVSDRASDLLPMGNDLSDLFSAVISLNQDPLVIRNTSLLVCKYAGRLRKLFDILLDLSGRKESSFIRGHYLLAAFQISLLEKSKQYRMIGFLLEERSWDDEDFLQYVVKIMGLGYAFFNNKDLLDALGQLGNKLKRVEELYFELGMANIKKAIISDQADQVREFMNAALEHFSNSSLRDREDASCFAQLISLLLDFSDGKATGNLSHRIADLRSQLMRYRAYNRYNASIGWATARETEMMSWYNMCDKIASLSNSLGELGWLNPVLVIQEYLLDIYAGQRSILQADRSGGIDHLIRPEILRRLSPLREKLSLLEQWMGSNPQNIRMDVATELVKDLERYKNAHFWGNESGTVSEDFSDAVPAIEHLNVEENSHFKRFVESAKRETVSRVEKVVVSLFEQISKNLDDNGFQKDMDIWNGFCNVLFQSLVFLEHRMNATVKNFPNLAYLFEGNKVLESALQDDYFNFVRGNLFTCKVTTERMDIAGGRSDVFFEFTDFFIVAEIKREATKINLEGYAKKYIGQTLAYQGTSAKLGFLFVLDLSDNNGGIAALESNVKLTISESAEGIKSGVVIMRMPGNRVTPSNIKREAKVKAQKKPATAKKAGPRRKG